MPSEEQAKLKVEAVDYLVRGMEIEEIFSSKFWEALKKEFPTLEIDHICFMIPESSGRIMMNYERLKGKTMKDYFTIGSVPSTDNLSQRFIEVLKEMKSQ